MEAFLKIKDIQEAVYSISVKANYKNCPVFISGKGTELELYVEEDHNNRIRLSVPARIPESGEIVLDRETLVKVISNLPTGITEVGIATDDYASVRIKTGKSEYEIPAKNNCGKMFSESLIIQGKEVVIDKEVLQGIEKTLKFSAKDDTRPVLSAVRFTLHRDKNIELAASNGFFLAVWRSKIEKCPRKAIGATVEREALERVVKIAEKIKPDEFRVIFSEEYASFQLDRVTLITRLVNGQFPNYHPFFDKGYDKRAVVPKKELLGALNRLCRIGKALDKSNYFLRLSLKEGILEIRICLLGNRTAVEKLGIKYLGETLDIGFQDTVLLPAIRSMDADEIVLLLNQGNKPVLVNSVADKHECILMPLR